MATRCRPCNGRAVGRSLVLSEPRKKARTKGAYCVDCEAEICLGSTRCKSCASKHHRGGVSIISSAYDGRVFYRATTPERALLDQARKRLMQTWEVGGEVDNQRIDAQLTMVKILYGMRKRGVEDDSHE